MYGIIGASVLHDALLILAAYYAFEQTPVSVARSLGAFDVVWMLMIVIGGTLGIIGSLFRRAAVDVTGCVLMASGKITWAVALLSQGIPLPSTYAVAAIFIAGAFGTVWRMIAVVIGVYLRARD